MVLAVIFAVGIVVAIVVYVAYQIPGTGFGKADFTKETTHYIEETTDSGGRTTTTDVVEDPRRARTLWDWMQVVGIPAALAIVGFGFTRVQDRRNREIEDRRARDAALQSYFNQIGQLLIGNHLRTSKKDAEVRKVARALTLTLLESLSRGSKSSDRDPKSSSLDHKFRVLRFLYEEGLIDGRNPIVSLTRADLTFANLASAELIGVNLVLANLDGAVLDDAVLEGAYLTNATLKGAHLYRTNLRKARLLAAKLEGATLVDANLTDAEVDKEQLRKCRSLEGATMPNGERFSASYLVGP